MKATPPYTSFNGGEISPELEGRVDIEKYHSSLFRCQNMIPMIQGPCRRRSGTRFVKEVKDSTKPPFIRKFIFSRGQSFTLEFGDHYVRFYQNHGAVLEASKVMSVNVALTPVVVTCTAHGYSNGDEVFVAGLPIDKRLNNRYYKVGGATANNFQLFDFGGNPVGYPAIGVTPDAGTVARVYTVATPYAYADLTDANGLFTLRFAQIADVLYITNTLSTYPVQKLSRLAANNWTLAAATFSGGPFKSLNSLNAPVLYASGQTGSVTVTALQSAIIATVGSDGGGPFITLQNPIVGLPANGSAVRDVQSNTNTTFVLAGSTLSKLYLAATTGFAAGDGIILTFGNSGLALAINVISFNASGGYFQVAVLTTTAGMNPGDTIQIVGNSAPQFNGIWTVLSVPSASVFRVASVPGLPTHGTGGFVNDPPPASSGAPVVFQPGHVGALLFLQTHDIHRVKPWETGKIYTAGQLTRFNGVTYKCFDAGTSGTAPPTHLFGDAYDGSHASSAGWTYQDPGYGWGVITAVASDGLSCTVTVGDPVAIDPPIQYPIGVTGDTNWNNGGTGGIFPTALWAIGAWNAVDGYPTHVYFFLNRLVFARFQDMRFSVSEDFENFAAATPGGIVTDDMAISITTPTQEVIQWLQAATSVQALGVGTSGDEQVAGPITDSRAFGPDNRRISPQGTRGSLAIPALRIANGILFVQASGKKIRKLVYEFYTNSWQSTDLAMLARGIAQAGIIAMDYQQEPDSVVWSIAKTATPGLNQLLGLTYDPPEVEDGQNVTAWHRHPLGASKAGPASPLDLTTIPAPDGSRDELWLVVQRTIHGRSVAYVEYGEKAFDTGDAQSSACFMDASLQYNGAPVTTLFPLDHLEGETVRVLADGAAHPDCLVVNGAITLQAPASVVQVGLPWAYDFVTLRIEAGSQLGTAQGKLKRISTLNGIRLMNSLGGKVGAFGQQLDPIEYRDIDDPMDAPPALFTGDKTNLSYNGDWERDGRIQITDDGPFPMTIVALFPELSTTDG